MRIWTLMVALLLGGCAVNRVEYVTSPDDVKNTYKVPVIYGVGMAEDSLPLDRSDDAYISFAEYDVKRGKGSGGCLGTADRIWIAPSTYEMQVAGGQARPIWHPPAVGVTYKVLLVPPGHYAFSMGVLPPDASPSVYFQVAEGRPHYLGDFLFRKVEVDASAKARLLRYKMTLESVRYDRKAAMAKLADWGIDGKALTEIPLIPTEGYAEFFLCAP